VLADLAALFPDGMVHLGGDEVDTSCFDENPYIQTFMRQRHLTTYDQLVNLHMATVRAQLGSGKRALYWSNADTFYQRYQPGDALVYWGDAVNITDMVRIYPEQAFVLAPVDHYYLDCSYGNPYGGTSWCDPMKTWWTIYQFEVSDHIASTAALGAEVPVWSEIMNEDAVMQKAWPRAAAMGDKHWAPKVPTDLAAVTCRQVHFRQYLNRRGLDATFISGRWCEELPEYCFGHYTPPKETFAE